jgi:hypothetical protein
MRSHSIQLPGIEWGDLLLEGLVETRQNIFFSLSELPFFFTVLKGVEMMCLCMSSVHFI